MNSSVHLSFFVLSNCSDMEIESARLDFVTSKATFNMLLLVQGWDLHIYILASNSPAITVFLINT